MTSERSITLVGAKHVVLACLPLPRAGLDERFRFGSEDLDVCFQLRRRFPEGRLVVTPDAVVRHHFKPSLRDTLRRSSGLRLRQRPCST